jgi:phosphoglycolate phosphatase
MLKLLIFDLDGTLIDSSKDIANAINYAIKPFGVTPLTTSEIKTMVGSGITKLIERLITPPPKISQDGKLQSNPKEKALEMFFEHYSKHLLDNTTAYPLVKETLSKLADHKKAVISNKRVALSRKVIEGLGLSGFFDIILGSDSVPEKKPSPLPILEVLKRLEVSRDEAVIIGDSNFDVEAGKAAGIKTIAVTYGYRNKEALKEADFTIDTFSELLDILKQINKSRE